MPQYLTLELCPALLLAEGLLSQYATAQDWTVRSWR